MQLVPMLILAAIGAVIGLAVAELANTAATFLSTLP